MSDVYPQPAESGAITVPLMAPMIACNHCGIVALDTPAFGWKRYYDEDGNLSHHCPAAVEYNSWIAQGLVHLKAPDEAIIYEDIDRWLETVGAHDD